MLKFVPLNEVSTVKNWILCQEITIGGKVLPKKIPLTESIIKFIIYNSHSNEDFFILVSNEKDVSENDIKTFTLKMIEKVLNLEIEYINSRYNGIITEEFIPRIIKLVIEICSDLDFNKYICKLVSNSIILRKSLDLSIMSFYFSINMRLKFKELEEIIFSSLLINIQLCELNNVFNNIHTENFLLNYKENLIKTSYELIKDDRKIPNNSKRIVKYANISLQNKSDIYRNEDNEKVLKDVTLEIIQLSNDILTYNFDNKINKVYLNKKYNLIQPALNSFVINVKKQDENKKSIIEKLRSIFNKESVDN